MDVEQSTAKAIDCYEKLSRQSKTPGEADLENAWDTVERHRKNWQIFLFAWWCLTAASLLGIVRILFSVGYFKEQKTDLFFIRADVVILCLMFLGYGFLTIMTAPRMGSQGGSRKDIPSTSWKKTK